MAIAIVTGNRYTVDPLYQWDSNQVLEIRGLSLPSVPEIHFSNNAMEFARVRQASMDSAGIIRADIPNTLLQKPYKITAHICMYQGDTFASLYRIEIPVNARAKPSDYTFEDTDGEIYSYNELRNMVVSGLKDTTDLYNASTNAYNAAIDAKNAAEKSVTDAAASATTAAESETNAANSAVNAERYASMSRPSELIEPYQNYGEVSAGSGAVDAMTVLFTVPSKCFAFVRAKAEYSHGLHRAFIKTFTVVDGGGNWGDEELASAESTDGTSICFETMIHNANDTAQDYVIFFNVEMISNMKGGVSASDFECITIPY